MKLSDGYVPGRTTSPVQLFLREETDPARINDPFREPDHECLPEALVLRKLTTEEERPSGPLDRISVVFKVKGRRTRILTRPDRGLQAPSSLRDEGSLPSESPSQPKPRRLSTS